MTRCSAPLLACRWFQTCMAHVTPPGHAAGCYKDSRGAPRGAASPCAARAAPPHSSPAAPGACRAIPQDAGHLLGDAGLLRHVQNADRHPVRTAPDHMLRSFAFERIISTARLHAASYGLQRDDPKTLVYHIQLTRSHSLLAPVTRPAARHCAAHLLLRSPPPIPLPTQQAWPILCMKQQQLISTCPTSTRPRCRPRASRTPTFARLRRKRRRRHL